MIVIFHSSDGHNHCDDGFAAAWVFWKRWPDAEFIPGVYGETPRYDLFPGRRVVMVDFSYKRGMMKGAANTAGHLLVLDHHRTAQAALEGLVDEILRQREDESDPWPRDAFGDYLSLPDIRFDMDRSGARMAWDYCFPGEKPPDLLLRIEDGDLWRWQYDDGKAVQAALRSYPQDFEIWDRLMRMPIKELAAEGAAIRRFIEAKVAELRRTAWRAEFGGVEMPVCNAPWFLASELAGQLAEDEPHGCAAIYFDQGKRRVFSLRARKGADVSEIAKRYGGGGHQGAAGFEVPKP